MTLNIGQRTSSATGGTISTIAGYTVHTFTTGGNFVPRGSGNVEVLVVGGGGASVGSGGGYYGGGGGGAVRYNKFVNVTSGTPYLITVGGAPGGISSCTFNNATITAYGGGNGGPYNGTDSLFASGGGGGTNGAGAGGAGAGVTGLGFPGGNFSGGGGGASSRGGDGIGSNGGIGVSYSITGTSQYYGGGGGYAGTPNGGLTPASYGTGNGTPGAVIIRYPT